MSVHQVTQQVEPAGWARATARKLLPEGVRRAIRNVLAPEGNTVEARELRRLWRHVHPIPPGANRTARMLQYTIRVNHGPVCYELFKDIFVNRIYCFQPQRRDPRILDCGSNNGMTILYFKYICPDARIIGFEPDPALYPVLEENIALNNLRDVEVHRAAVSDKEDTLTFYADGLIGSMLVDDEAAGDVPRGWARHEIPALRMRDFLEEPVDFLKMNIEGAEWSVLSDCADRLRQIREMVVEYHHLPGLPRTLHLILELLHREGFEYAVSDFGLGTYASPRPPVELGPDARYYRHLYARRKD